MKAGRHPESVSYWSALCSVQQDLVSFLMPVTCFVVARHDHVRAMHASPILERHHPREVQIVFSRKLVANQCRRQPAGRGRHPCESAR